LVFLLVAGVALNLCPFKIPLSEIPAMETELLSVQRASHFVAYCMEHDLQILAHRREAYSYLCSALAKSGDINVISMSGDKFDKMMTYLQQNDQQVHYASAGNTVGTYAIVKLVAELRRRLRDHDDPTDVDLGHDYLSPRNPPVPAPAPPTSSSTAAGAVPRLDLGARGRGASSSAGPSGV